MIIFNFKDLVLKSEDDSGTAFVVVSPAVPANLRTPGTMLCEFIAGHNDDSRASACRREHCT